MGEVVHLSPLSFGPDGLWGGGERYALELAREMSRRRPTRLVTFGQRARRQRLGDLRIDVLPLRTLWKGHEVNPLSELLPLELAGAEVVHAHHYQSLLTNLALILGRGMGKPVYVTDHGGRGRNYSRRLRLDRLVTRLLAVSEFAARTLLPELEQRTSVVYGGVNTGFFRPEGAQRGRHLVFVGRVEYFKGIDALIQALGPDDEVQLVGETYDPAYRRRLHELAEGKRVVFRGQVSEAELLEAYRSARAFVIPSIYESEYGPPTPGELFPLVSLEALACGTPVICTDVGGMPEAIVDGENGFVVPPGDGDALGQRMRELLHDDALFARMSDAAVTTVRERFTWAHVADRCLEAYDTMYKSA